MEDSNIRYRKALKEVYIIINNLKEDLYIKIPISLIKSIKENMDKNYKANIDELENTGKMQETIDIMSLIYRDYLCDKKTKYELKCNDEKMLNEKYSIFFKEKPTEKNENTKTMELVIIEEKWYKRIVKKFLNLFTKK